MRPIKMRRFVILHRGNLHQFDDTGLDFITDYEEARDLAMSLVDKHGGQAILFQSLCSVEASEMEWATHEEAHA